MATVTESFTADAVSVTITRSDGAAQTYSGEAGQPFQAHIPADFRAARLEYLANGTTSGTITLTAA